MEPDAEEAALLLLDGMLYTEKKEGTCRIEVITARHSYATLACLALLVREGVLTGTRSAIPYTIHSDQLLSSRHLHLLSSPPLRGDAHFLVFLLFAIAFAFAEAFALVLFAFFLFAGDELRAGEGEGEDALFVLFLLLLLLEVAVFVFLPFVRFLRVLLLFS